MSQTAPLQGKTRRPACAEEKAFLDLIRTTDMLSRHPAQVLKGEDLSMTQYNVLRILRGAGGDGLICGEIADRMITRDPDITRLLDRLERRGYVSRSQSRRDRRCVLVKILPRGETAVERVARERLTELRAGGEALADALDTLLGRNPKSPRGKSAQQGQTSRARPKKRGNKRGRG